MTRRLAAIPTKDRLEPNEPLYVVDLFCGGGGLACGFDLHQGHLNYQTVLGVDNNAAAIKIFNSNFQSPNNDATFYIGRLADVTWFTHPIEIRLFYLVHFAHTQGDQRLLKSLLEIGLSDFLARLRSCDAWFTHRTHTISKSPEYIDAVSQIPSQAFVLALPKAFLNRLALSSLTRPEPAVSQLPWTEEYEALTRVATDQSADNLPSPEVDILSSTEELWSTRLVELKEAAEKTGRGQHKNNSPRLKSLVAFLNSPKAEELRQAWTSWRAVRDTIRAEFCLAVRETVDALYFDGPRASIVLGGPPCKGFSRVGRPILNDLRDQGVHAWSHKEYGDERNALMCQYVLFLEALQPDVFLFENVANFQSKLKTPTGYLDAPSLLGELIDELSEGDIHYHVHHQLVNARHFAVPQDRRRFIMFGVNSAKGGQPVARNFFRFPKTYADVPLKVALLGLSEATTFKPKAGVKSDHESPVYNFFDEQLPSEVRRYLSWIQQEDPATGEKPRTTTAHIYRESREDDRIFIKFVAPGIRWMDLKVDRSATLLDLQALLKDLTLEAISEELKARVKSISGKVDNSLMIRLLLEHTQERFRLPEQHLLREGYLKNGGSSHGDWLERLSATKPCRTIVAHIGKDTYAYWHPTEPRAITIREAARVQSFPDFFRLGGAGVVDTYSVIGNAVPPLLAGEFAERIERLHDHHSIFGSHKLEIVRAQRPKQTELHLPL